MKTIFRNCTVLFEKRYPVGTEVLITPNYGGKYGVGKGYYMGLNSKVYPPKFLEEYVGLYTGVSEPISTEGYSKISLRNGKESIHAVLGFLGSNGLPVHSYYGFNISGGAVVNAQGNYDLTLDIPSTAVSVILAKNTNGAGILESDYKAYFIV